MPSRYRERNRERPIASPFYWQLGQATSLPPYLKQRPSKLISNYPENHSFPQSATKILCRVVIQNRERPIFHSTVLEMNPTGQLRYQIAVHGHINPKGSFSTAVVDTVRFHWNIKRLIFFRLLRDSFRVILPFGHNPTSLRLRRL